MKADMMKLVTFQLGADLFAADVFSVERVLRYAPPSSCHTGTCSRLPSRSQSAMSIADTAALTAVPRKCEKRCITFQCRSI